MHHGTPDETCLSNSLSFRKSVTLRDTRDDLNLTAWVITVKANHCPRVRCTVIKGVSVCVCVVGDLTRLSNYSSICRPSLSSPASQANLSLRSSDMQLHAEVNNY